MEKDRNLQRVIQLLSGQNDPLEVIVPLFAAEIVLCSLDRGEKWHIDQT